MDNRINLQAALVDFTNVETTGQTHDGYPSKNSQARFDHMRSYLIGLLSHQASDSQPVEYQTGTIWYRTSDNTILIRKDDQWLPIANTIADDDGNLLLALFARVAALESKVTALQALVG